jgi:predicted Holliday junction resolvase-like endonuclease
MSLLTISILIAVILFIICIISIALLSRTKRDFKAYIIEEAARKREVREQAIKGSRQVLGGKFTEQMAPYLPEFKYDPTEARFIGSPIDLIVFPGLAVGEPEEVVLIEIKTGQRAALTPKERKVRELVEEGKVRWELIHRLPQEG